MDSLPGKPKGFSALPARRREKRNRPDRENNINEANQHSPEITSRAIQNPEIDAAHQHLVRAGWESHSAFSEIGAQLLIQKRPREAETALSESIRLNPTDSDVHNNLGIALKEQGKIEEAITSYNRALKINPQHAQALNNLGNALALQKRWTEATECYKQALAEKPDYEQAHNNLGLSLHGIGNTEQAKEAYQRAIAIRPGYADAHYNLANALRAEGNPGAASESYRRALEIEPANPNIQWNLGLTLLMTGDYNSGWPLYAWRSKKNPPSRPHCEPACEQWAGSALNPDDQLLVISEQGLGDTLQFIRYAFHLRDRGITVRLCIQPKLAGLVGTSAPDIQLLTHDQAKRVNRGHWAPLLSLPQHLGVTPTHPQATAPYIIPDPERQAKWSQLLQHESKPVIGLHWQGNSERDTLHPAEERSFRLEEFAPIAEEHDCIFVSLQQGPGSEQLESSSFRQHFSQHQERINKSGDFQEMAAIASSCDLVITNDTCMAHLAGAMGQRTWLLLQHTPDWRWGMAGNRTFWYPTMRLFRQKARGNWHPVIRSISSEIHKLLEDPLWKKQAH
jgi:Tfp pilus assembly protein PilF